jgi:hypothetical protein
MEKIKAVEMVRQIRDRQYLLTKDMLGGELMDYFKQQAKILHGELSESYKINEVNREERNEKHFPY